MGDTGEIQGRYRRDIGEAVAGGRALLGLSEPEDRAEGLARVRAGVRPARVRVRGQAKGLSGTT